MPFDIIRIRERWNSNLVQENNVQVHLPQEFDNCANETNRIIKREFFDKLLSSTDENITKQELFLLLEGMKRDCIIQEEIPDNEHFIKLQWLSWIEQEQKKLDRL